MHIYMCIHVCIFIYIYSYVCIYVYMYVYMYICEYLERSPANAADPNPGHVRPPRPTPGDVRVVPETNQVINHLSGHTVQASGGVEASGRSWAVPCGVPWGAP